MRKLKLDIDELTVESFSATDASGEDGTVHGQAGNPQPITIGDGESFDYCNTVGTCPGPTYCCPATWKQTCPDTCYNTQCGNSCVTWFCNTCASCDRTCNGVLTCDAGPDCPPY